MNLTENCMDTFTRNMYPATNADVSVKELILGLPSANPLIQEVLKWLDLINQGSSLYALEYKGMLGIYPVAFLTEDLPSEASIVESMTLVFFQFQFCDMFQFNNALLVSSANDQFTVNKEVWPWTFSPEPEQQIRVINYDTKPVKGLCKPDLTSSSLPAQGDLILKFPWLCKFRVKLLPGLILPKWFNHFYSKDSNAIQ